MIAAVLENPLLRNGSIILLHSGAKYTAEALEELIAGLERMEYRIVPVSRLIYENNFHMDADGRQVRD